MRSNLLRASFVSLSLLLVPMGIYAKEKSWDATADIRGGYLRYDYDNAPLYIDSDGTIIGENPLNSRGHTDSKGIYATAKFSAISPTYQDVHFKFTLAGATDFGLNDEKYEGRNFVFDPSERKSFFLLQEAYLVYETKKQKLLIGREELTTPMIDKDDWYMLANSFELAYFQTKMRSDTVLWGGYFSKMAGVWDSGANGTEFHAMSDASFVSQEDKVRADKSGIYFAALEYDDKKHHKLQLWNYYGVDLYNTLFMQYDYLGKNTAFDYDFGLQYINFTGVGALADHETTTIDYSLYAIKFDGSFANGFSFATGYTDYGSGDGQGATLGAFGGYPYFANGMIFHFFEAGSLRNATSYKGQLAYSFNFAGLKNIWAGYRYTCYNLDPNYSRTLENEPQSKMVLNGLQLDYSPEKSYYFTITYEGVKLDYEPDTYALRLIGGYRF